MFLFNCQTTPEGMGQLPRHEMPEACFAFYFPRNDGEAHAGAGTARATGIGLNVSMIRNAPSPMIHEPI